MWVGSHLALLYIHQVNSRNDMCHDDITINIVQSIIIIIEGNGVFLLYTRSVQSSSV